MRAKIGASHVGTNQPEPPVETWGGISGGLAGSGARIRLMKQILVSLSPRDIGTVVLPDAAFQPEALGQ